MNINDRDKIIPINDNKCSIKNIFNSGFETNINDPYYRMYMNWNMTNATNSPPVIPIKTPGINSLKYQIYRFFYIYCIFRIIAAITIAIYILI